MQCIINKYNDRIYVICSIFSSTIVHFKCKYTIKRELTWGLTRLKCLNIKTF